MMEFFQNHRLISSLIALSIAIAATALLIYLSSTADVKPVTSTSATTVTTPAVEQYAPENDARISSGATEPGSAAGTEGSTGGTGSVDSAAPAAVSGSVSEAIDPGSTIESTQYVDVDGDGMMETLVLARGDGESRPLDWYLMEESQAGVQVLFKRKGVAQGEIRVDGPRIVEQEGLYLPDDGACCPSQLKISYYVWKDGSLVVSSVEQAPPGVSP
jgi:hypothetical protein